MTQDSQIPEPLSLDELGTFVPKARYNHQLDALVYRREPGLCVADRVDPFLTVLWSRGQKRLVGVRFKGLRYIFSLLKDRLNLDEAEFLPLVRVIEVVVEGGLGQMVMDDHEGRQEQGDAEQREEKYVLAMECVQEVHLTRAQIREVVAA